MWVISTGKMSEAHSLFLEFNLMALNEPGLGDLKALKPEREAFYRAYRCCDPKNTRTGISGIGGKYFRFVYEVKTGDMVLFPSLLDYQVYFGYVISAYSYNTEIDYNFPHQRSVRWTLSFDKSKLSEWAKRELGAARSFFEFKRNIEEVLDMIDKGLVKKISLLK